MTGLGLSFFFIIIYGGTNWITAHRTHVGTWYYPFERYIPFVPSMILPYMSIDLFFVGAPFLCQSRAELNTLARRIAFAIIAAGCCFLLFPLRIAAPPPETSGWAGTLFNLLHGFDRPYNLFPSLHITFWVILARAYARHTKGAVHLICRTWFALIGLSTLLTYQHHVADVAGGLLLALVCFYLFRETQTETPLVPNYRVGTYYFAGAVACVGLAWAAWPWTAILLWPAVSLGIAALGYWKLGPGIYRKEQGRVPTGARFLLAPVLIGHRLSLAFYRRQCDLWNEISPRVWVGARLNRREAVEARRSGVTAVLDLTAEFSESRDLTETDYLNIPVLDLTGMEVPQLEAAVGFIASRSEQGVVYIHCKAGYSRTAMAAGAYLLSSGQAETVQQALDVLRKARPAMVFRPEVVSSLTQFHGSRLPKSETGGAASQTEAAHA
jgi:protein-tyrosine phosphatase/membrane-associated phospholipid phosphatase